VPAAGWREAEMVRPWRGNRYDIRIERSADAVATTITLDGEPLPTNFIAPPAAAGATHTVVVQVS
jgi:cellobiose phosphorylase